MRQIKGVLFAAILAICARNAQAQWPNGYTYAGTITVPHAKVPTTDLSNFPVMVSGAFSDLATTANGGKVTNSKGYDIVFASDIAGQNPLFYEREAYNNATGQAIFWVNLPTLSHSVDTTFYIFYGNTAVTADQSNPSATWSSYQGVWHMDGDPTLAAPQELDSTSGAHHLTDAGNWSPADLVPGQIGNSILSPTFANGFAAANSNTLAPTTAMTLNAWVKINYGGFPTIMGQYDQTQNGAGYLMQLNGSNNFVRLRLSAANNGGQAQQTVEATAGNINDGNWHQVTVTYASGTSPIIYVDGQAKPIVAYVNGIPTPGASTVFTGSLLNSAPLNVVPFSSYYFQNGTIDEVRVTNVVRSPAWIAAEFNNQSNPSTFITTTFGRLASPGLGVLPSTLTYSGTPLLAPTAQALSVTNTGVQTLNWTATTSAPWITLSTTSTGTGSTTLVGTNAQTIYVFANSTLEPIGSYSGTVTFSAPGANPASQVVNISLAVTTPPNLSVSPTALSVIGTTTSNPAVQPVNIANTGGGLLTWTATSNQAWLVLSSSPSGAGATTLSGSGAQTIYVSALSTTQPLGGPYSGTITINAPGATPATQSISVSLTVATAPSTWPNGYSFGGTIVVSHLQVPNTDQSGFPVLVSGTYPALATTANGGKVTNANGYDIIFTSDPTGLNPISYERELYRSNGQVAFWVRAPVLSHVSDTVLYIFYGNSSVTTDQSNPSGTWDSNYLGVWHLEGNPAATAPQELDSTSLAHHLTDSGDWFPTNLVPAIVGNGIQTQSFQYGFTAANAQTLSPAAGLTVNAWVNINYGGVPTVMSQYDSTGGAAGYQLNINGINNTLRLNLSAANNGGDAIETFETTAGSVNDGKWHHVAATYSTGNSPALYIDGQAMPILSYVNGLPAPGAPTVFHGSIANVAPFAMIPVAPYAFQNGTIDEARVSNVARSADWIATEYHNELNPAAFYTPTFGLLPIPVQPPSLSVSTTTLSFAGTTAVNPASSAIVISNSGGGTLNWSVSANQPWVTFSTSAAGPGAATLSGTGQQSIWVLVSSTTMQAGGPYTSTITVTAAGAVPASRAITVSLTVQSQQTLYNGIILPTQWPPQNNPTQAYSLPSYITNPPAVIPVNFGRQLFVDDFLIESNTLQRNPHQPVALPANPILSPGGVDSASDAFPYSDGVWIDPVDGLFKMWYLGGTGLGVSYAYSTDGKYWTKPTIADAAVPNTNIVISLGYRDSATVWMDLNDPNPNQKFKAFIYQPPASLLVYFSADGIHWNLQPFTINSNEDRTTVFYNPFRKVWVDSMRGDATLAATNNAPSHNTRVRYYAESPDLINWSPANPTASFWAGPDENDPPYVAGGARPELYNVDGTAYESLIVGLFSWWNPGPTYDPSYGPGPDLVELGVGFSRDGFNWVRPTRGGGANAFIAASNQPGTWNAYNTQSAGGGFLVVGNELWFYYSGRTLQKPLSGVGSAGLATLRRDGFYSMDAGATQGILTTHPLTFTGNHLYVNVNDPSGQLQVEILDQNGNVLPAFSQAASIPLSANSTLQEVHWTGVTDLTPLIGTPVKLRFHLTNGSLYSFWFTASTNGASYGYLAAGGPYYTGTTDTLGTQALPPGLAASVPSVAVTGTTVANPSAQTFGILNTGGGFLNWTATSNQPWLTFSTTAGGTGTATLSGTGAQNIYLQVASAGMAVGSYTANITLTATGLASPNLLTVPVALTVNYPPPVLSVSSTALSASGTTVVNPTSQPVTITNPSGGPMSWTATSTQPWLTLSTTANGAGTSTLSGSAPATFYVQFLSNSVAAGSFTGAVNISAPGATPATQPVSVALAVTQAPGVSVSAPSFTYSGTTIANPTPQSVNITNSGGGTLNWTATSNQPWLTLSTSANGTALSTLTGTGAQTVFLRVASTSLAASATPYSASVSITAPSSSPASQNVAVSLTVSTPPGLSVSSNTLSFAGTTAANPAAQSVAITNSGGGTLNWTATSNQTWLQVSTSATGGGSSSLSGTGPATLFLQVTSTSQAAGGPYSGAITLTATNASPATQTVNVALNVTQATGLSVAPPSLTYSGTTTANPAAQSLAISNSGGGTLNWTATSNQPWLTLSSTASGAGSGSLSGTGAQTFYVQVASSTLTAGPYTGSVTVNAPGATPPSQTIAVSATVTQSPGVSVSAPALSFAGTTSTNPVAQSFGISNSGGGTLNWTATVNQPWMTLSTSAAGAGSATLTGTGAQTLWLQVSSKTQATGTFTGSVNVSATGAVPASQNIAVSLAVTQPSTTWPNGYNYAGAITVPHLSVPNSDQTNFPVMISGTYSDLATTANGGKVTNANGYDIIFTSDSNGLNRLNFEREIYSPNGQVLFWVQVPTVSHTVDTVFYVFYGNSTVTADSSNRTATWDSNYLGVWHMDGNPAATAPQETDSTTFAHNLTASGSWGAANLGPGAVGPAITSTYFDNGFSSVNPASLAPTTAFTLSGWIKTNNGGFPTLFNQFDTGGLGAGYSLAVNGSSNHLRLTISAGQNGGSTQTTFEAANGNVNNGAWHQIAATYTSGPGVKFFVDGVNVTASPSAGFTGSVANSAAFSLAPFLSYYYIGSLDEMRVSNAARSADWIATEYNNQNNPAAFYTAIWGLQSGPPVQSGLSVVSTNLTYTSVTNASPVAQSVSVTNSGGGTLNWSATVSQPWITLATSTNGAGTSTLAGTGPQTVWIQINSAALAAGPYTGTVTFSAPGASPATQIVNISLAVAAPPGVAVSPTSLSYLGTTTVNPAAQSVSINNSGGGSLSWTATVNQPWLTLSTSSSGPWTSTVSGVGAQTLWIQASSVTQNAGGPYSGAVTIAAPGASPASQSVNVTLNVSQPLPALSVAPGSLIYFGTTQANPSAQPFAISNSGGGTLTWTVTANQPWITLSATAGGVGAATLSGSGPQTVFVQVASTTLAASATAYVGSVSVSAPGAVPSSQSVGIGLTVSQGPGLSATPLTLSYAGTPSTNPSAQSVAISNSGSGTLNWTATSNQPWITLSTSASGAGTASLSGTGAQTIWVLVSSASQSPGGPYSGTVTLSASGATPPSQTVNVSLSVSTPSGNSKWPNGYSYGGTITVPHGQLVSNDLTNFPVLVSGTYPALASVANGGNVTNANGYDIVFTSDANGLNKLNFERGSYNSTGQVLYWVQVPTVSHTTDTTFYVFYGNASVTTDQSNPTATWDSTFSAVWHLSGNPGGIAPQEPDSTSLGHALTASGPFTAANLIAGQVGNAISGNYFYNGFSAANPGTLSPASAFTLNAWIKINYGGLPTIMNQFNNAGQGAGYTFAMDGTTNRLRLTMSAALNGGSGQNTFEAANGNVNDGNWHHVAARYTSGPGVSFFVDGVSVGSATNPAFTGSVANASAFTLIPFASYYYLGNIDEPRVSNVARSNDWVAAEFKNQNNPATFYSTTWGLQPAPALSLSPTQMTFSGTAANPPASQSLAVANSNGVLNWTGTSNQPWLTLSTTANGAGTTSLSASGGQTVWVQAAPGTLAAGPYTGAITFAAPGAASQTLSVSFTVQTGLSAVPASVNFSGSTAVNPPAQALAISTPGGSLAWTATSNQSWLTLSSTANGAATSTLSGTGAQTIWLHAATAAQTPGASLTASIAVSAPGATPSTQNVTAALNIGNQYYVSTAGIPAGDGSIGNPWDLQTALNQPATVHAGDTLWLRAGTYGNGSTIYTSNLNGTATQPIVVRQYTGERATINGGLSISGSYTWFWGFEVTNLAVTNRTVNVAGSNNPFPDGFDIYAPGSKFINLIVHDTAQGFGFWTAAQNSDIYGSLIYNNGWQGSDRGHGHGIYTQNQTGTKTIADNIVFQGFALGIQAYGSPSAFIQNYALNGNTIFNSGTLVPGGAHDYNLLFAGGPGPANISIQNTYTYHKPSDNSGLSSLDWPETANAQNLTATNNYWIGGNPAIQVYNWTGATFTNNTAYSQAGTVLAVGNLQPTTYTWNNNTYWGSNIFLQNSQTGMFTAWQSTSGGLDAASTFNPGAPTVPWIFLRPNLYEAGRANITIYNWSLANTVAVDPSLVLNPGDSYQVRNAQDYFNSPVLSGTYAGGTLAIPMMNLTAAQPIGVSPTPVSSSAPAFGAFVLLKQ